MEQLGREQKTKAGSPSVDHNMIDVVAETRGRDVLKPCSLPSTSVAGQRPPRLSFLQLYRRTKTSSNNSPTIPSLREFLMNPRIGVQTPRPASRVEAHTPPRTPTPTQAQDRSFFQELPVELVAEILSQLDLPSLIIVSGISRRFRNIASDPALNPWRGPILRSVRDRDADYEPALKHLGERSVVPRSCWLDILASARSSFLLFEATIPNLPDIDYQEVFHRRFLPSWKRWRTDNVSWKEVYRKSVSFSLPVIVSSLLVAPTMTRVRRHGRGYSPAPFCLESFSVCGIERRQRAAPMKRGLSAFSIFKIIDSGYDH